MSLPRSDAPDPDAELAPPREFLVLVAGVLTALAAQAWWESREDRGRERDYLRQLLVDTRENERRLATAIAEDSAAAIGVTRAMDALQGSTRPPPPADSVVAWVRAGGAASDFQPLAGTYAALLGTGDLRLAQGDALRQRLATYAAAMDVERERLAQYREVVIEVVGPMARAMPFMRRVFLRDPGGLQAGDAEIARMRDDPEVAAVLLTVQAASTNRLSALRRLRRETGRMREALEADSARHAGP